MQLHASTLRGLAFGLLLLTALAGSLPPAERALSAARAAQAPEGTYLFVELWYLADGTGVLPMLCVDFPGYRFDPATGRLEPFFGELPPLLQSDLGFAGRGHQRTGSAGCGVGSALAAIPSLPYTTTLSIGTGETTDYGEVTRSVVVVLEAADETGALSALIDGEEVTLDPGARWSRLVEADLVNDKYNGHYLLTSSVTNYGWQSRALIAWPRKSVWAPIVTR
jgi:hypothetical protein